MPAQLTGIRVFIASPSGLETERALIGAELQAFNEDTGYLDGVCFIPVGWEERPSGVGRPQGQINEDVRNSDFFVLMLWDRWGSPPGDDDGRFTSGVDEEYHVAAGALLDAASPMRDIAVLFKGVDARQLSDPGEQLDKVLAFRQELEREKTLMFSVFDSSAELRREIRKLLFRWTRAEFESPKASDRDVPRTGPVSAPTKVGKGELQTAMKFARAGRALEAEQQFSAALANASSPQALAEYAKFLRRSGRFAQARSVSQRLLRDAERSVNFGMMIEALASLGVISRKEGLLDAAISYFEQARGLVNELDLDDPDSVRRASYALDNYGHTLRRRGDLDRALEVFNESMTLRRSASDLGGRAYSLNNLGIVQRESGLTAEAMRSHEEALEVFRQLGWTSEVHITESHLGSVFEDMDQHQRAEELYGRALAAAAEARNEDSLSINLGKLARLKLKTGDLPSAFRFASECVESNERSGNEEGSAMGVLLLGQYFLATNASDRALEFLEQALERYTRIGHTNGRVQALLGLTQVYSRIGDDDRARHAFHEAGLIVASEPSPFLAQSMQRIAEETGLGVTAGP